MTQYLTTHFTSGLSGLFTMLAARRSVVVAPEVNPSNLSGSDNEAHSEGRHHWSRNWFPVAQKKDLCPQNMPLFSKKRQQQCSRLCFMNDRIAQCLAMHFVSFFSRYCYLREKRLIRRFTQVRMGHCWAARGRHSASWISTTTTINDTTRGAKTANHP